MKTNVYFGLAVAVLAITLQASPSQAKPRGVGPQENGFGSRTPVTLPPDRHPPGGKSTGIPVTKTSSSVLINAQPKYFRLR